MWQTAYQVSMIMPREDLKHWQPVNHLSRADLNFCLGYSTIRKPSEISSLFVAGSCISLLGFQCSSVTTLLVFSCTLILTLACGKVIHFSPFNKKLLTIEWMLAKSMLLLANMWTDTKRSPESSETHTCWLIFSP